MTSIRRRRATFADRRGMHRHVSRVHFKDKPYTCAVCNAAFVYAAEMRAHARAKGHALPEGDAPAQDEVQHGEGGNPAGGASHPGVALELPSAGLSFSDLDSFAAEGAIGDDE